jgi:Uma2 family endonuclease
MATAIAPNPELVEQAEPKPRLWTADESYRLHDLGFFLDQQVDLIGGVIIVRDTAEPRIWTAKEAYRLLELGFFQDQRVELIGGKLLLMASQKNFHAVGIKLTEVALIAAFGPNYWVRVQASLDLSPLSIPDPDLAVIAGMPRQSGPNNPTTALLTAEVSDTTLRFDRSDKASLYAAAGIQDYWIINLVHKQVEVHRKPTADAKEAFGWRYDEIHILSSGEFIVPLAVPQSRVAVDDLLP